MIFDIQSLIVLIPAILLSIWAQYKVSSTFTKYSSVSNHRGYTASDVTRNILDSDGLNYISVDRVAGNLTDHYDPRGNIIRLSDSVYGSTSVAAIGVAAHEAGHALQHNEGYAPIKLRNAIVPVTNIASAAAMPLFIIGMAASVPFLMNLGILIFIAVVAFHFITLPVEFNASNRAIKILEDRNVLSGEELQGAKKVLSAAALTYVAAAVMAIANLLRLLMISRRRN